MKQGWAWPGNASKAHFFDDGISLCGKWMFHGQQEQPQTMGEKPNRNDCVVCWRKVKAQLEKAKA